MDGIREFLIRFSRFGLVEKKGNSGWLFEGSRWSCSRFA
jgi:DNA-binding GntR family transcriptional regulator